MLHPFSIPCKKFFNLEKKSHFQKDMIGLRVYSWERKKSYLPCYLGGAVRTEKKTALGISNLETQLYCQRCDFNSCFPHMQRRDATVIHTVFLRFIEKLV